MLALGGDITHPAYRASKRTGSVALRRFAVGFGVVTLDALSGGGVHQLAGAAVLLGVLVQNAFTAVGLGILAYSVCAKSSDEAVETTSIRVTEPRHQRSDQ